MKLQNLKIGDKITHYCSGKLVEGTVIEKKGHGVICEHEPVRWGNDTYTQTGIYPSTYLQKKWGGTDKNGQPTKGPETTPGAWYKGKRLKSPITG